MSVEDVSGFQEEDYMDDDFRIITGRLHANQQDFVGSLSVLNRKEGKKIIICD